MTPKEEKVWALLVQHRHLSDEFIAEQTGVEPEFVRHLIGRISSPNWREPRPPALVRDRHVGESDYSARTIQPWDIWREYNLNPWDADIIKRVLRTKPGQKKLDYQKIIHVCEERIRQLENEEKQHAGVDKKESSNLKTA